MGEGLFDFLDTELDVGAYVEECLKEASSEDPFPGTPDLILPIVPVLPHPVELIDTTKNRLYTIETRSVNGKSPAWYLHTVWDNYGIKDEVKMGRKADVLFHNKKFLDAIRWHFKVLNYLNESGL